MSGFLRFADAELAENTLAIGDEPVESESEANVSPAAQPPKPCKGGQNTAGDERSVTPGYQSTRQRVPCELGSPRNALRLSGVSGASRMSGLCNLRVH